MGSSRWSESYPADYSADVRRALFGLPHDYFVRGKADWLNAFAKRNDVSTMLDIGCGIGLLHRYLNTRVTGIDVSKDAIEEARKRNPGAQYQTHDGHMLPFDDGAFDVCLAVTVLHHIPPAQWQSFVIEAARVARKAVVIIEHNPRNPGTRLSVWRSPLDHDAVLLSARRSKILLRNAELQDVQSESLFWTAQYAAYGLK